MSGWEEAPGADLGTCCCSPGQAVGGSQGEGGLSSSELQPQISGRRWMEYGYLTFICAAMSMCS